MGKEVPKDDEIILVVNKDALFGKDNRDHFQGFRPLDAVDYESRILGNVQYIRRGDTERDDLHNLRPDLKQPIAYLLVLNPSSRIFVYQRAKATKQNVDVRLAHKFSWGAGGHIAKTDEGHPIHSSKARELSKELGISPSDVNRFDVLGYINDDSDSVGKDHFGILYAAHVKVDVVHPQKDELKVSAFLQLGDLEKMLHVEQLFPGTYEIENWSRIAFGPLKKYFEERRLGV